jgi:hypothetical protein
LGVGVGEEVGWVGLAEAKLGEAVLVTGWLWESVLLLAHLLQIQRCLDLWDILVDPPLERLEVDGLPDFACHILWDYWYIKRL